MESSISPRFICLALTLPNILSNSFLRFVSHTCSTPVPPDPHLAETNAINKFYQPASGLSSCARPHKLCIRLDVSGRRRGWLTKFLRPLQRPN